MLIDPIIEEVRAIRNAFAAEHENDLEQIFNAIKAAEAQSARPYVVRAPRLFGGLVNAAD